jgi:N6-adenosine-specific RNA methylase IME4
MKPVHCSWVDMKKIQVVLSGNKRGDQAALSQTRCVEPGTVSKWKAATDIMASLEEKVSISKLSAFQPQHAYILAAHLRRTVGKDPEDWDTDEIVGWVEKCEEEEWTVAQFRLALLASRRKAATKKAARIKPDPSQPVTLILADPPWEYDFSETDSREIENQYVTAPVEEIQSHISAPWAPPVAEECVLFLWATAPKLREALSVVSAWGFEYKTNAVWDKEKIGMGYWFRGQHELLLVGTRGSPSPPDQDLRVSSVFREPRGRHSAKPSCVYEAIESMFPEAVKAEFYQRVPREGWVGCGNEVPSGT